MAGYLPRFESLSCNVSPPVSISGWYGSKLDLSCSKSNVVSFKKKTLFEAISHSD
jgi:hypothetical protein